MTPIKLTFYHTPSHGYLRVSKRLFTKVGANPEEVSRYSGHDANTLYLEEDCDAPYFFKHLEKNNIPYELKWLHSNSVSATHNYDPLLFDFKIREGVRVKLCNDEIATLEFVNGVKLVARTTNGNLYRIPKTNPFKYIIS